MNRQFGIEMEIAGITRETALAALRAVNIKVESESYNHDTRNHWKLVVDTSVRNGFEVVSPILKGEAGLAEAEVVARALDDAGASVNSTCGLHVHFDASDLNAEALKSILRRYASHESEIDAFMPRSRRGDTNRYCRSIVPYVDRLDHASTVRQVTMVLPTRYMKVNLKSIPRHGTIEFRQHSGTVNAAKIVNWVRFLAGFIEQCKRANGQTGCALPSLSGVQARLAEMFQAHGTVTLATIMEAFGWRDITSRAAITRLRKAGMEIQATRVDGQAAYMFNGAIANQPDSLWTGIEPAVAMFYQRRAAVLAVAA